MNNLRKGKNNPIYNILLALIFICCLGYTFSNAKTCHDNGGSFDWKWQSKVWVCNHE